MERSSETVQTSGEREVGVAQSGTNQVGGVSRHIATLVVTAQQKQQYKDYIVYTNTHLHLIIRQILKYRTNNLHEHFHLHTMSIHKACLLRVTRHSQ